MDQRDHQVLEDVNQLMCLQQWSYLKMMVDVLTLLSQRDRRREGGGEDGFLRMQRRRTNSQHSTQQGKENTRSRQRVGYPTLALAAKLVSQRDC